MHIPDYHRYQVFNIWCYVETGRWTFFKFLWAQRGWLSSFHLFLNGQRIHGNFKAKGLCQTRLNIWRNRTMFPWVREHQAKLWKQDQLFKKLSVQNPWDILVHFPHVWKAKTETRAGGALIQGYNISTLHWKFKITSKGPPASKWVTVTQGAKHRTNRRRDISLCNIISSKNSWGFKRETSFLLSFCRCQPG